MSRTMKQRRDTRIVACQLSNASVVQLNRPQTVFSLLNVVIFLTASLFMHEQLGYNSYS